jgi:hypothetical protein
MEKEKSHFHKNKRNTTGVQTWCKVCVSKSKKASYRKHMKKVVQLRKKQSKLKFEEVGAPSECQKLKFADSFAKAIGELMNRGEI